MPIDYSKWKDIEISDDEDDTHPNVDTPSLFKWRHEARVQRMKEVDDKKLKVQEEKEKSEREYKELQQRLKDADKSDAELVSLKKSIEEIDEKRKAAKKDMEAISKEDDLRPWNVDTISSEGFSKTKINKSVARESSNMTEEEKEQYMREFVNKNKDDLKKFGWLSKFDDSKAFMLERSHLACEESANFLVIECLNLAMEEKFGAMEQVAHQCICVQYLLELSKQLDVDPRSCISSFFTKIQVADPEYKKAFDDELVAFKDRIRRRAKEKIQEQLEEEERLEREARLGPGGLDPIEVLESLPKKLKECFESQDIAMLQNAIADLDPADARLHMKRCVDSGLWKPAEDDPNTNPEDGFRLAGERHKQGDDSDREEDQDPPKEKKEEEEGVYSEVGGGAKKEDKN